MEQDRNLLFGVFAVQLGKVTSSRLMQAAAAWAVDPVQALDRRLVQDGAITEQDRELIQRLVDEAIRAHSGDAHATLSAFGGEHRVMQTFGGTIRITPSGVKPAPPDQSPPVSETGVPELPGRYRFVSETGRGGYGRVLLVHDEYMARDVALKELIPPSTEPIGSNVPTPSREAIEAVARFLQEAKITGQLEHPSIVPVYELGHRSDGALYYTMKLVRGETLSKQLSKCTSLRERLELLPRFLDLCHAIAYAHNRGVIHRDIKPDNVMIGSFGETVVIDWGLAKIKGKADVYAAELKETVRILKDEPASSSAQTLYGTILGTPHFMSPEQAKGDIDSVDERSDVYALGAVLYMLLTGQRPYEKAPLNNVILHINLPPLTPVHALAADAPPELATICNKALQRHQSDRYQNAAELAQEIQRFMSGALVQAHQYTLRDQVRRFVQRHKGQVATAAAAALLLVAVAVIAYVQVFQANVRERSQRIAAERAEQVARIKSEQEAHARALAEYELYRSNVRLAYENIQQNQFAVAHDLLEACPPGHRHFEWGWLLQLCNQDLATLRASSGLRCLAVTRNGKLLVAGGADGTITVWNAESGDTIASSKVLDNAVNAVAFNSDGTAVAVAGASAKVVVCSAKTLEPKYTIQGHNGAVNDVAFSPDGKYLATASSDDTARIWDVQTQGAAGSFEEHLNDVVSVVWFPDGSRIITGSLDNTAIVWDIDAKTPLARFAGHTNDVNCVAIAPDGRAAASGGADGKLILWDTATGQALQSRAFAGDVRDIAFSPDGIRIVVADGSAVAQVCDARALEQQPVLLRGHAAAISSLVFLEDTIVATAAADAMAKQWYAPRELAGPAKAPPNQASQELHLADGRFTAIAFASTRGNCSVFDVRNAAVTAEIHDLGTTGLGSRLWAFAPDAEFLLYTGDDHRPKLLRLADGARTELDLNGTPFYPAISPKGDLVALSLTSGALQLFDARSGSALKQIPVTEAGNHLLPIFTPDATRIVVLTMDKQDSELFAVDIESGASRWKASYDGTIADAAFAPGAEKVLLSGSGGARWYSVSTGEDLGAAITGTATGAVAFSPDGGRLAVELPGGTIGLFAVVDGGIRDKTLQFARPAAFPSPTPLGHNGLVFSEDGQALRIATSDCQGTQTYTTLEAFPWSEDLAADQPLHEAVETFKRSRRSVRRSTAEQWDRAHAWLANRTREARERVDASPVHDDPFAHAEIKEFDVSAKQWTMLLDMGRRRLKQLRDIHGYRGMKIASDLVLDTSLAEFLSVLGFQNSDIIVRINDSSTPGYDMFIEALESARRADADMISVYFMRAGTPIIHIYHRTPES